MTIIALLLLAIIVLLLIAGLILWQRRTGQQYDSVREVKGQLTELEDILRDIRTQQAELSQTPTYAPEEGQRKAGRGDLPEPTANQEKADHKRGEERSDMNPESLPRQDTVLAADKRRRQESGTDENAELKQELPAQIKENTAGGNSEGRGEAPALSYNIGKSGRTYTEEELELLIKE